MPGRTVSPRKGASPNGQKKTVKKNAAKGAKSGSAATVKKPAVPKVHCAHSAHPNKRVPAMANNVLGPQRGITCKTRSVERGRPYMVAQPKDVDSIDSCIIFLHWLGGSAHDFGWLKQWATVMPKTRVVVPTAKLIEMTYVSGIEYDSWNSWFNFEDEASWQADAKNLKASSELIYELIEDQIKQGISPERIILAGFSQGAAMALWAGLQARWQLGGVVVLHGYCPNPEQFKVPQHAMQTPVLMCHGAKDHHSNAGVNYEWALFAESLIKKQGVESVELKTYKNLAHNFSENEYKYATNWMAKQLYPEGLKMKGLARYCW